MRERERSLDREKEDLDINLKGQHVSPRHSTKQALQHLQVNHVNKMGVGPRNWLNRHFSFLWGESSTVDLKGKIQMSLSRC